MKHLKKITGFVIMLLFLNGCATVKPQHHYFGGNNPSVVVAFGDSITHGSKECSTPYPSFLSVLSGKYIVNAGISGSTSIQNVKRVNPLIKQNKPGFFLILYGLNDAVGGRKIDAIIQSLRQMVLICKENNVVPVLGMYPIPEGNSAPLIGVVATLNQGIKKLSKEQNVMCADLPKIFSGRKNLFGKDGIHPNDNGTYLIASEFYETLKN